MVGWIGRCKSHFPLNRVGFGLAVGQLPSVSVAQALRECMAFVWGASIRDPNDSSDRHEVRSDARMPPAAGCEPCAGGIERSLPCPEAAWATVEAVTPA